MKFLQVFSGRKDAAVPARPEVSLTVAAGFTEDKETRIPKARLCESLRKQLNVVPGSLLKVSREGRVINCRVGVSSKNDENKSLIRLNPRARKLLGAELGNPVTALVNTTPISSSAVPLEVAPAIQGDEQDAEPIVRLSLALRRHLGLTKGDYVNVKNGDAQVPARVEVGARGDHHTARLNPQLRGMLQVEIGDLVEVVPYETLVLLIDTSGSMDEPLGMFTSKMKATREAIHTLIGSKTRSRERDLVGLVSFGEECELLCEPTDDFARLGRHVGTINGCGRTAMFEGLEYTLELLADANGLKRTILLSDGCPTTTGAELVLELAYKAKLMGVVIDTIGVGGKAGKRGKNKKVSYDEVLLKRIASLTGGKFTTVHEVQALEDEFLALSDCKKIPLLTAGNAS
ncbi:MAG: VWA domain-containing protein [Nitrospirota bacterium]|nr:VWA domain-containing protein [Nitrospirota bacterium]